MIISEKNDFFFNGNPELLAWARMNEGMDRAEAATKLGTDEITLADYETGKATPMFSFVKKCAELYKRPLATFLLPKPPKVQRRYPVAITIHYIDGTEEKFKLEEDE